MGRHFRLWCPRRLSPRRLSPRRLSPRRLRRGFRLEVEFWLVFESRRDTPCHGGCIGQTHVVGRHSRCVRAKWSRDVSVRSCVLAGFGSRRGVQTSVLWCRSRPTRVRLFPKLGFLLFPLSPVDHSPKFSASSGRSLLVLPPSLNPSFLSPLVSLCPVLSPLLSCLRRFRGRTSSPLSPLIVSLPPGL